MAGFFGGNMTYDDEGHLIMTEQNEDAPIMQATLELPEGDVILTLPAVLSVNSAQKLSIWLRVAAKLQEIEVTP